MPGALAYNDILRSVASLPFDLPEGWAIFGSAALLLNGVDGIETTDIDILVPYPDMLLCAVPPATDCSIFYSVERSEYEIEGVTVDVSHGLQVWNGNEWCSVEIAEVVEKDGLRYASLPECVRLLKLFGRPKDIQKLSLLFSR